MEQARVLMLDDFAGAWRLSRHILPKIDASNVYHSPIPRPCFVVRRLLLKKSHLEPMHILY